MTTYEQIVAATANFTKPAGLRTGKSRRYTRYLQPGLWDLAGQLMLRSRATDRHIARADFTDREAIAALAKDCDLCDYR